MSITLRRHEYITRKGVRVNELQRSSQYSRGLNKQVDADINRPVCAMNSNKINVINMDGNQMVSGS